MKNAWVSKIMIITLVGGLCLGGYGLAHAEKPIKPRFSVLHNDPAWVLDRTTGLQWQIEPNGGTRTWTNADAYCSSLGDGSRLPENKELISLVDYSVANPGPVLPADNPFLNVVNGSNWSATPYAGNPANAWYVDFGQGNVNTIGKTGIGYAWCVR